MQVDSQRLANHLARLHFPGPQGIKTVVLRGRYASAAHTLDHHLVVVAPPLEGVEPPAEEIGVDLDKLIRSLRLPMFCEYDRSKRVRVSLPTDLSVTPEHLVLRGSADATVKLRLARPSTVESQMSQADAEALFAAFEIPGGAGSDAGPEVPPAVDSPAVVKAWAAQIREWKEEEEVPRTPLIEATPVVAAVLHAKKVVLSLGRTGGRIYIRGKKKGQPGGDVDLAELPYAGTVKKPYQLTFAAEPLLPLLVKLQDAPEPHIHLFGPRRPVVFTTGDGFRYLLASREARRTLV